MNYYNFSGGARGADMGWEIIGKKYNVQTVAFSFDKHRSLSPNREILTDEELHEGWEMVLISAAKMGKYVEKSSQYVRRLLSRNWFQVKNADAIFAIGNILKPGEKGKKYVNKSDIDVVDGGTGYAVMMGIESDKPVYVFDQDKNNWFKWDNEFIEIEEPTLSKNFAGVGTRELNQNGINAIKSIYKKTFNDD